MSAGVLTADGQTEVHICSGATHLSVDGTFGSGTITVQKRVEDSWFTLYDNGTAITFTAADDAALGMAIGDPLRLSLAGSTSPSITWSLT